MEPPYLLRSDTDGLDHLRISLILRLIKLCFAHKQTLGRQIHTVNEPGIMQQSRIAVLSHIMHDPLHHFTGRKRSAKKLDVTLRNTFIHRNLVYFRPAKLSPQFQFAKLTCD